MYSCRLRLLQGSYLNICRIILANTQGIAPQLQLNRVAHWCDFC